ncbi:hypothetical protein CFC21_021172, partial [Triticum aestivum]
FRKSLVKNKVS